MISSVIIKMFECYTVKYLFSYTCCVKSCIVSENKNIRIGIKCFQDRCAALIFSKNSKNCCIKNLQNYCIILGIDFGNGASAFLLFQQLNALRFNGFKYIRQAFLQIFFKPIRKSEAEKNFVFVNDSINVKIDSFLSLIKKIKSTF